MRCAILEKSVKMDRSRLVAQRVENIDDDPVTEGDLDDGQRPLAVDANYRSVCLSIWIRRHPANLKVIRHRCCPREGDQREQKGQKTTMHVEDHSWTAYAALQTTVNDNAPSAKTHARYISQLAARRAKRPFNRQNHNRTGPATGVGQVHREPRLIPWPRVLPCALRPHVVGGN
jgi:hypothetical protein